jgi:tetratricopeptide (TPR) repeat protein
MAGSIISKQGGIVIQYLGDGLLALFGAQTPSERDPERSIRAALDIQGSIDSIQTNVPIQLRVGIHTGLVVTGDMGSDAKREYTATGVSMTLAERLQSASPPGGVVISRQTYRHVRGVFDVEIQPPLKAKGITEPVQTYHVLRAKSRPYRVVTRGVRGVESQTVGRDAEQRQLHEMYLDALTNRNVVWAQLVGEPGVGKTRMLTDMAEVLEFAPDDLYWLRACAFEDDVKQPFALVRRMWFEKFQIAVDLPIAEAEDRWIEGFQSLQGSDAVEAAHALGLLVGLPFEDSPGIGGMRDDPAQVKGRAFTVSCELLGLIREKRPLIILIEDLHWADRSSWEYITEVLLDEAVPDRPNGLFVLATARTEWNPSASLLSHSGYVQIDLPPLSASASRDLVVDLLQHVERMPDDVISSIVERAEGVPYFAEEMVNWFLDRGVIDRRFEPWRFVPDRFDETPLPETLQHLLFTRLSSLSFTQQEILQRGSIFGRDFWEGGLIALKIQPRDELLGDLEQRDFIKEQPISAFVGEREWSFHHSLMRDVAYESILKRRRPGLHHAAGEWLETQARRAGRLDEFAGRIGGHAELAGDSDAAADWYTTAGERAWSQGAFIEARDFFNRALELLPLVDRERRWHVLLKRDAILSPLAENELRDEGISSLLELARGFKNQSRLAEALYRQGVFFQGLGDFKNALGPLESAVGLARETRNQRLEALGLALIALCQTRLGELELAAAAAKEALLLAERLEDDATLARVLNNVAICFAGSGDTAKAAGLYERQVEVANRFDDIASEAAGQGNLGFNYAQMGLFEKSRETLEKAMRLNETLGARRAVAYNLLNLALVHWRIGDARTAQQLLEKAHPVLQAIGETFGLAIRPSYLALSQEQLGDLSDAMGSFEEAKLALEDLGLHGYARDCMAGMARCALAQGFNEKALQHASELWDHLEKHGVAGMEFPISAYVICAEVFDALGEGKKSGKAVEAGYRELKARADKIGDTEWRKRYMENVPEHRAIREMWDRRAG